MGQYIYDYEDLSFTMVIPDYWHKIYRGQPRENLYPNYADMVSHVKKVYKDKIVLDVGVNHALFSLPCSLLNYQILGFEPVLANYNSAVNNMELNGCKNYNLYNYALGNKNEEVDIFVPECPDNASFSQSAAIANMQNKVAVAEKVKVIRFDDWISEHPEFRNIGFIKIDVQGFEVDVITGMQEFLKQANNIYMIAEYEDHLLKMGHTYSELDELILSLGFKLISQIGNDKLFYKS